MRSPLTTLLAHASITLDAVAVSRDDAIRQAGAALVAGGAVDASYLDAMIERENLVSTFIGDGVAIPHATLAAKGGVRADALSFLRFPAGVDWDGNDVRIVFGLAAVGRGHIALLSQLATVLLDPIRAEGLRSASTIERVYELLSAAPAE